MKSFVLVRKWYDGVFLCFTAGRKQPNRKHNVLFVYYNYFFLFFCLNNDFTTATIWLWPTSSRRTDERPRLKRPGRQNNTGHCNTIKEYVPTYAFLAVSHGFARAFFTRPKQSRRERSRVRAKGTFLCMPRARRDFYCIEHPTVCDGASTGSEERDCACSRGEERVAWRTTTCRRGHVKGNANQND